MYIFVVPTNLKMCTHNDIFVPTKKVKKTLKNLCGDTKKRHKNTENFLK